VMKTGVMRCVVLASLALAAVAIRLPSLPLRTNPLLPLRTSDMTTPEIDSCTPEPLGAVVTLNKGMVDGLKGVIDLAYAGRDIPRFYVLETVARVPYFSYLSCLHLYESLGMRGNARLMRMHYAEADNELHHLLIMEALGGGDAFIDRFVAQHLAFAYFWYSTTIYLLNPRAAYHLTELIEEHAFATYNAYLRDHEGELKAAPVPDVARRYYEGHDAMRGVLHEAADVAAKQEHRNLHRMRNLHDVFVHVRDDEADHWDTLTRLVNFDSLDIPDECEISPMEA